MPQRKRRIRRRVFRLAIFSLATWGLVSLGREPHAVPGRATDLPAGGGTDGSTGRQVRLTTTASEQALTPAPLRRRRRVAASFAFAALFCAGASFSAIAGDGTVKLLEEDAMQLTVGEETAAAEPEAAPAPEPEFVPAPEPEPEPEPAAEVAPAAEPAPEAVPSEEPSAAPEEMPQDLSADLSSGLPAAQEATSSGDSIRRAPTSKAPKASTAQAVAPFAKPAELDPEATAPATAATVWLNRPFVDPTPPSMRLSRAVVERLFAAGNAHGVDWALVLGVLRADGVRRPLPLRAASIPSTAAALAAAQAPRHPARALLARTDSVTTAERAEALERYYRQAWSAALAVTGRTAQADRAVALAKYYRAVGTRALVRGLSAEHDRLGERLLADPRVSIYSGGRADVEVGRIDVRVLALVAYLAESYGQVTVSSLFSGHRLYSRPGVVSAHIYGQAVDIAALGGLSVVGNQAPGGLTERAVRDILLLPAEVRPRQVISLLGLGGPSFPLADHDDHIHVGF